MTDDDQRKIERDDAANHPLVELYEAYKEQAAQYHRTPTVVDPPAQKEVKNEQD